VVPEYWHPGHLSFAAQARLAGSDHPLLLLAGVNNGDHQATMVVLDPLRMSGVGTPKEMRDHRFELLNMPAAHEVATVLLPRSTPSLGQPYTRAMAMNVTTERIIVEVSENTDSLSQIGFVYEFDYFLHVVAVTPRNGVVAAEAHRKLEAEGRLHGAWNPAAECAQLKAGVIVRWSK
jgi:hypothetical protein